MQDIAPMIAGLGFFTMVGWIVFVIVDGRRRRDRIKVFTEFHTRLLDRIGSAKEFGEFLQTDGGKRFLDSLSVESGGPKARILRSMQVGIVLLSLGVGFMMLAGRFDYDDGGFTILGTLCLSLAIGFILSTIVSYFLARSMSLLSNGTPGPRERSAEPS